VDAGQFNVIVGDMDYLLGIDSTNKSLFGTFFSLDYNELKEQT